MKRGKFTLFMLAFSLLLAACNNTAPTLPAMPTDEVPEATAVLPEPTPTAVPEKVLNVCSAVETKSLSPLASALNIAEKNQLSVMNPDPLSVNPQNGESLFFEQIPTEENGGITLEPVTVRVGQPILDASGTRVYLAEGTLIEHAINYSLDNPVSWNHEQDYQMNQFSVSFKLKPDLKWSDGVALTAEDFVFAYQLASQQEKGLHNWNLERTASFVAEDEQTLVWKGIPGFVLRDLDDALWSPLPAHLLKDLSTEEQLLQPTLSSGAYKLLSSESNQTVMEPNPFFVLNGAYPAFDKLHFNFVPDLETALSMLENGQCDVLDQSYQLESLDKSRLETLSTSNQLIIENWQPVQQLVFGIEPSQYDTGYYDMWTAQRQDILGDLATRQAIAACLDPQALLSEYIGSRLPDSLPIALQTISTPTMDANQALDDLGWLRSEENPSGPRIAQSVNRVLPGTELRLSLLIGQSQLEQNIAAKIQEKLGTCGVAIEIESLPAEQLYAPGPDGRLFGRNFELALISWQPEHRNNCQLYTSDQMPASINSWIGTNLAGLSDAEFDEACWRSSTRLTSSDAQEDLDLMAQSLPAIPLMPHYQIWLASKSLQLPEEVRITDLWQFLPQE